MTVRFLLRRAGCQHIFQQASCGVICVVMVWIGPPLGLERWGVKKKSCAVIVLDGYGKVLFAKNGTLTKTETKQALDLIDGQIV